MDKKSFYINIALSVSLILIFVAALLPILRIHWVGTSYMYAVGAAGTIIARILDRYKGNSVRVRRLHRMEIVSALCYGVSAFLLFWAETETDWLAFLTVGAVLQVYTSFMIPYAEKQEKQKK